MDFEFGSKVTDLQRRLLAFMDEYIYRWSPTSLIEDLKAKARGLGLWNLFLPNEAHAAFGGRPGRGPHRIDCKTRASEMGNLTARACRDLIARIAVVPRQAN